MSIPDDLIAIVNRIANGIHTNAGLEVLRGMLSSVVAAGAGSVAIRGDANGATIVTGNGNAILNVAFRADGLEIDGCTYRGDGAEMLRSLLQEVLSPKISWHQISQELLEERFQLTTNPMTAGYGISYQVGQVHVPLGLLERKKIPKRKEDVLPERGSALYISDEERYPDRRDEGRSRQEPDYEEIDEVEITKRFEHEQFLEQVLRLGDSPKSQGKRIAIIGEPGAGKTTLLQQIARWVSETIPKSVVIWISLADLQRQGVESYLEEQWLQTVIRRTGEEAAVSQAVKRKFSALFKQKRVWLLLDGLDEMPSHNPLDEVNRQVSEGGWLQQARIVLTCRLNLWDSNRNALYDLDFDTYRTLDFSYPEQVEQFIGQWFTCQDEAAISLREGLCVALKAPGKDRIRDLVKNPLRLTLLCFSWNVQQGRLPETQAELYEQFIEDFYSWKQRQFPTRAIQRRQLNAALGELAREAIDKETTRFRLRQDFVKQFLGEDEEEPGSLIQMALQLGWLNRVGFDAENPRKKVYAFFHPTFEEYFAASAIDNHQFFLNHFPSNPNTLRANYRIFEPQWKQVFLLWLGCKDEELRQQKESLIGALITFKDGCKGVYRDRSFFLAAEGIAEFKDCSLSDVIILRLLLYGVYFGVAIQHLLCDWPVWVKDKIRRERAAAVLENTNTEKAILHLEHFFQIEQTSSMFESAAEILKKINPGNRTAIQILIRRLETVKSKYHRQYIIKSLGTLDPGNETAVEVVVRPLKTMRDESEHRRAAEILGEIGAGNETAVRALVRLLETTRDEFARKDIVRSLGKIGAGNETAVRTLVHLLETIPRDSFSSIFSFRKTLIETLGEIGIGNETAIRILARLLETMQNNGDYSEDHECEAAAESLGKIGAGSETAIRALLHFLETVEIDDYSSRSKAVESLIKMGIESREIAVQMLVRELETTQNQSGAYLRDIVHIISKICTGNESAIRVLIRLVETAQNTYVQLGALQSLSEIAMGNETAIQALLVLLETWQNGLYLTEVAESLGKIDPGNEKAIQILLRLLEERKNDFHSKLATENLSGNDYSQTQFSNDVFGLRQAAESLGKVDPGNETAIRVHLYLLEHVQDISAVQGIAEGLNEIDPGNRMAIQALAKVLMQLVEILQSDEAYQSGRFEAINNQKGFDAGCRIFARKLGEIGLGSETAIQALLRLIETTQNTDTRHKAIENLGKIGLGRVIN
jgi:HEAT repeat protein/energy-coupling factor transporter ATP-binding protein EcfA2